jgi:hypothetical protein
MHHYALTRPSFFNCVPYIYTPKTVTFSESELGFCSSALF